MVGALAVSLKLGMERGEFVRREPFLAAAESLRTVIMPLILFQSGKLADSAPRDPMVAGVVSATTLYLKTAGRHALYLWWLDFPALQAAD